MRRCHRVPIGFNQVVRVAVKDQTDYGCRFLPVRVQAIAFFGSTECKDAGSKQRVATRCTQWFEEGWKKLDPLSMGTGVKE